MVQSSFLESDNPVDFLYLDKQRISSLIGQLSNRGVLTAYKSIIGKASNLEGQLGASVGVAKADGKRSQSVVESAEETFDPFWTHVYSFIQDLEANFAVPLGEGHIGSLVKFEGLVQFLDMGLMRNIFVPSVMAAAQAQSKPTKHGHQGQAPKASAEQNIGAQFLKDFPHLFHMTFLAEEKIRLWSAVQPENLTISSADLTMKYGAVMDGIWTSIGIIDGNPGKPPEPLPLNESLDGVVKLMAIVRQHFGRPENHFGFTPIAIYAPIHGISEMEAAASTP
jgi:hypothetical protein